MTHLIIGSDDALIAIKRDEIRKADPSGEIQLKSASDFDPERLSDAPKVYVVGDFPEIVSAYGDRVVVQDTTDTLTDTPSKKRSSK